MSATFVREASHHSSLVPDLVGGRDGGKMNVFVSRIRAHMQSLEFPCCGSSRLDLTVI